MAAHGLDLDRSDAENRYLRRIEQRGEGFDAEAPEIADGEGGAGEIVGRDAAGYGLRGELLHAFGEFVETKVFGAGYDGDEQAAGCVAGEPQIHVRVLADSAVDEFGI